MTVLDEIIAGVVEDLAERRSELPLADVQAQALAVPPALDPVPALRAPGLAVIAPSARIGPVLLDPKQVRLPKISAFGKEQLWTRRSTPATWKDDPILAATQTALLPDLPHQVEEGYIRIAPDVPDEST